MDGLAKVIQHFQYCAYEKCGIDVDALPEETVRIALKRLLGIAANSKDGRYITACKEIIEKGKATEMNKELRCCRFCGSHGVGFEEQEEYNNRGRYFVCCYDCYATGPLRMNSELALKAWNDGVSDDVLESPV